MATDLFGNSLDEYGGLFGSPEELKAANAAIQRDTRLALGLGLLKAGAPSLAPVNWSSAIAEAGMLGVNARDAARQRSLREAVLRRDVGAEAAKREAEAKARAAIAQVAPQVADGSVSSQQFGATLASLPGYERAGIDLLARNPSGVDGKGPFIVPPGGMLADRAGAVLLSNPARGSAQRIGMVSPQGHFVALPATDPTIPGRKRSGWQVVEDEPSGASASTPVPAEEPAAVPTPAAPDAVLQQAREAISNGADPAQVAERLRALGIDPSVLTAPSGVSRGPIRRDIVRPLEGTR